MECSHCAFPLKQMMVIKATDIGLVEEENGKPMSHSVAFHTLKGGHFDGELQFSIEEKANGSVAGSVTLAIRHGGHSPRARLAERMVSLISHSIAQSILI